MKRGRGGGIILSGIFHISYLQPRVSAGREAEGDRIDCVGESARCDERRRKKTGKILVSDSLMSARQTTTEEELGKKRRGEDSRTGEGRERLG